MDMESIQPITEPVAEVINMAIGKKEIEKATVTLAKYKEGKSNLEKRVIANEEWYRLRHWEQMRAEENGTLPEPASAWLFNAIANKHADAMDNFPEPVVLPRESGDQADADILSSILPVILQRNNYEQTYDEAWWDKLKNGTAIYGTFWNNKLENGLGDIDDKQIDILNIFWQPGINDIQKSRNVFTVELVDNEILEQQYPVLKDKLSSPTIEVSKYNYDDTVDTSESSVVVDWYYKKQVTDENGAVRDVLHYCKFCNNEVLFASENNPEMALTGWYEHGQYPFTFDVLFPEKGTPCGFGYIDIAKNPQEYIDKLDQLIVINADEVGNPRYFARDEIGMNEDEFLDKKKKIIHISGQISDTNLKQHDVKPLPAFVAAHQQSKIEELKETSGNRDFSQGGTTSGVTAASAIAALQEAGSKLSRDPIKASYRKFAQINNLHIELIRQFYTEPRQFRITGQTGQTKYINYMNSRLVPQSLGNGIGGGDLGFRRPIFDINVKAQKTSPFSTVAQNENAKELYKLGAFNPQMADQALIMLEMMTIEGKEALIQKISQNSMIIKVLTQILPQILPIIQALDMQNGTNMTAMLIQLLGMQDQFASMNDSTGLNTKVNPLGNAVMTSKNNTATKAQEKAANTAAPK